MYTTGDVVSAVQLFLGLLRGFEPLGSPSINGVAEGEIKQPNSRDRLSLDDFRVAFGVSLLAQHTTDLASSWFTLASAPEGYAT